MARRQDGSRRLRGASPRALRLGACLGLASTLLLEHLPTADAAIMLAPGTTLPGQDYLDHGARFANSVVAIRRLAADGTSLFGSGVRLDDRHVLTAAHVLDTRTGLRPLATLSVGTGTDFGNLQTEVSLRRYEVHPSYVIGSGLGLGSQIDLAIVELNGPLPGRSARLAATSAPVDTVLDLAGYGQFAIGGVDMPLQPQDGRLRGFQALSLDAGEFFDNYFYTDVTTVFGLPSNGLLGYGANRDSGGGVFLDGELVGLITAGLGGTSATGRTTFLDLTRPEVRQFLDSFVAASIPEPTTALLLAAASSVHLLARRRRASPATGVHSRLPPAATLD